MPAEIFPEYILIRVNETKCKKEVPLRAGGELLNF